MADEGLLVSLVCARHERQAAVDQAERLALENLMLTRRAAELERRLEDLRAANASSGKLIDRQDGDFIAGHELSTRALSFLYLTTVFVISPELGGRGGEGRSAKSPLAALSLSRSLMSLSLRDDSRCKRVAAIRWLAVFKRTTLGLTAREVT